MSKAADTPATPKMRRVASFHPTSWKGCSPNVACRGFSEVAVGPGAFLSILALSQSKWTRLCPDKRKVVFLRGPNDALLGGSPCAEGRHESAVLAA